MRALFACLLSASTLVACSDSTPAPSGGPSPESIVVERMNAGQPIIAQALFEQAGVGDDGANINGASVIRVPDWIPAERRADPSAVYYLYFADHEGAYIRLAWAAQIAGPWSLHGSGAAIPVGARGVLDLGPNLAIPLANGLAIVDHIASPDVHVDDDGQRIIMYFHGWTEHDGLRPTDQKTLVATSNDGLDFTGRIEPVTLGRSYFRVFGYHDALYAFANRGDAYRARDTSAPWAPPASFDFATDLWELREDNPWDAALQASGVGEMLRHVTVTLRGDVLHVLYTRIAGTPEQILHSTIDLADRDFAGWEPSFPADVVLAPELAWEGGDIAPTPSVGGPAPESVCELRDPFLFEDADGRSYLFYAGRGEDAIGVAEAFWQ
jgi:hypothetical protein